MNLREHEVVEAEITAARLDGIEEGIRLAAEVLERNVADALQRPDGHGGPELDEAAQARVRDLYQRYLGIGGTP